MSDQYLGEIRQVGFDFAPVDWQKCAGQLLKVAESSALFALLGIRFGGNGYTDFGIPDLRGRIPIGVGNDIYHVGQMGGAENIVLSMYNMPAHTHSVYATTEAATDKFPVRPSESNQFSQPNPPGTGYYSSAHSAVADIKTLNRQSVSVVGSSASFSVIQPTAVTQFIIAIEGQFPSRS